MYFSTQLIISRLFAKKQPVISAFSFRLSHNEELDTHIVLRPGGRKQSSPSSSGCVSLCLWRWEGCEHELVLTSLHSLSDIQTGSHCHMTEVSAPCPIAPRASPVWLPAQTRATSFLYTHVHTEDGRMRTMQVKKEMFCFGCVCVCLA